MVKRIFPFLAWLRQYDVAGLKLDAVSGLTVALVLIPQSMAYAQLAGLPAYYGLYASFLPPMLAALFGSSRQLATGPVAVVSLMTAASLEPLATAGSEAFIAYAVLLALLVGVFQFLLGALRLGLVVNFLSHPVVNGFTNAAAIIIASSQLSKMFGVHVDKAQHHYETIVRVIEAALVYTHWPTLAMGLLAFGIMYGLKRLNPRIPNVLVAVALTTVISWATGFEHNAKVALRDIESPEFRQLAMDFNSDVNTISVLGAKRAEVNSEILKARKTHGKSSPEILNLQHELSLITVRMSELDQLSHEKRVALRSFLFSAIQDNEGRLHFYVQDQMGPDQQNRGRSWHIRVGNEPLNETALLMTGGGAVVGKIPRGLPTFTIPKLDMSAIVRLFPFAAIISLLGFMEAISIAKAMAAKTGQRLDPNQELIGQGIANILGAVGKSYPVSGSFSRSAVNLQAGGVTGLSSVVTSLTVVTVLLFFTPLLYYLPQSVLAAVIMMAVIGLVNISGFIHAWKAQWYDGVISIVSFVCTLAFAPHLEKGIEIGVVLSLGVFLYKSMRPRVGGLSMHDDRSYRDAAHCGLLECEHVALVRFDGPLFFANASYLEDQITELTASKPKLKHIVIVANGINDMDASGEEVLSLIIDRVRSAGYQISLSGVKESVLAVMKRTHLYEKIGEEHIFPTQAAAVESVHAEAHAGSDEKACPLTSVCPAPR
jgi:SulP family sulfate permease